MENISKIIDISEKLYNNKKTIKYGINNLLRYYEAYILSDDNGYLKKGFIKAQKLLDENKQSISIAVIYAFFAYKFNKIGKAYNLISEIKKYSRFIKKNNAELYCFYLYVDYLIRTEYGENTENVINELQATENTFANVVLADIYIKQEKDYKMAGELLVSAYEKGNRSKQFYWVLFAFYKYKKENNDYSSLLIPLFRWGLVRGADLKEIIELNAHKISLSVLESLQLCFKLYNIYSGRRLLTQIIRVLMNNFDYSETAYKIYFDAVNKQMEIKNLNWFLIKTSFRLGIEDIGVYPIQEYLENAEGEDDVKAFVYHIMLNNKKFEALREKYALDICSFGLQAYLMGLTGQYYNSIYKFILDNDKRFNVAREVSEDLLNILSDYAFCYEITVDNKKAAYVRIKQKSITKMAVYELKDGRAIINAINDNFLLYLFDEDNKEILTGEVKKNKLIPNGDFGFYLRLYRRGFSGDNILIYLASFITETDKYSEERLEILLKAFELKSVSRGLRMKIIYRLAMFEVNNKNKEKAINYFKKLDLNYINEKNIENLINVLLSFDEISMAVNILLKKAYLLSDKTVFRIVRKAATDKAYNPMVRGFAYELLLKGHYDRSFVEIVKDCYSGGLEEWLELSEILSKMKVPDQRVDEKIIQQSILTRRFDKKIQKVFNYLYKNAEKCDFIKPFIEFICYNIIIEKSAENNVVNDDTIKILEEEFLNKKNIVVGYALSLAYVNQGVTTDDFYAIIKEIKESLEENEINIPELSKQSDKAFHSLFIDKFKPFIYKCSINKRIFMYYKRADDEKFNKVKMKYFKFGLYMACVEVFYNEEIEYYFSEETEKGSIQTEIKGYKNTEVSFSLEYSGDFYALNNAFINMDKARFDLVEDFISSNIIKKENLIGQLL